MPRTELDKLAGENAEYKAHTKAQRAEIAKRDATIQKLHALKDATAVAALVLEESGEEETFHALVAAASKAVVRLPSVVQQALFQDLLGRSYHPADESDLAAAEEECDEGTLTQGDDGFAINENDASIANAVAALRMLEEFLLETSDEFSVWYAKSYKNEQATLKVKPFWRRHLAF